MTKLIKLLSVVTTLPLLAQQNIPLEIAEKITKDLPVKDILHLCATSQDLKRICEDQKFWRMLTIRDFGNELIPGEPEDQNSKNWKDAYRQRALLSKKNVKKLKELASSTKAPDPWDFLGLEREVSKELGYLAMAQLEGINLSDKKFYEPYFFKANLRNANLSNAHFFNSKNWTKADLTGANLENATIENVTQLPITEVGRKSLSVQYEFVTLEWLKAQGATWDPSNPPSVRRASH